MTNQKVKPLSIAEYASALTKTGIRIIPNQHGTIWVRYESVTMMRMPTFNLSPPNPDEIRKVFWKGWALVASFILEPDMHNPPNACVYICTDREYTLDKLVPAMRRNVRRGLKELRIAPITADELLYHGAKAFYDTRRRVGLGDGTYKDFRKRFALRAKCSGHVFLGAWKDNQLAAFLSITDVENWAEIEGSFSMNAFLKLRPNDTLMFCALQHYLVEKKYSMVSFGLSSIQNESNEKGLHAFKTKIGFEAKPVLRVFAVHPLLRLFVNKLSLWGVNTVLRFRPNNRMLKKAGGMLELLLDKKRSNKLTEKEMYNG